MTGFYVLELPASVVKEYGEWTEAVAFRFVKTGDTIEFQVSNDLELVTRPDGAQ